MSTSTSEQLRGKAEALLRQLDKADRAANLPLNDVQDLLHELSVHQVELELQGDELRATAERLGRMNERYVEHFLSAPIPSLRINTEGVILELNLAAQKQLSIQPLQNKSVAQSIYHSGAWIPNRRAFRTLMQQGLDTRDVYQTEIYFTNKHQHERIFEVSLKPLVDAKGQQPVSEVLVFLLDRTGEVRAREEREQRYRTLEMVLDSAITGYWDWDIPADRMYFSPSCCRMLGYKPDELEPGPETLRRLVHPDDSSALNKFLRLESPPKGEFAYYQEVRLRHKRGDWIWIICSAKQVESDATGKPLRMVGCHIDINAQKQSEQELQKLYQAVEQSPATIVITNTDSVIEYVNPAFERTSGYTREEAIGQNPRILNSGKFTAKEYKKMYDSLHDGGEWHAVFHNKRKDGSLYWESAHLSAVKNEAGVVTHFLAVKEDITQRKAAEENLQLANKRLAAATAEARSLARAAQSANEAKSAFLASMSHEIRTPMNGILGMNHLLLDTELTDEQKRYANTISSSTETLLSIIDDILDFSKIEAGKLELERIPFDFSQLLTDLSSTTCWQAENKGIAAKFVIDPNVPKWLTGDPVRLRQVITNLVTNAIKFTSEGAVTIKVDAETPADPPEDKANGPVKLRVAVIDTGIGIPQERVEDLFQQFSQVDSSTTRRFGGTGLGLAISKQLITLMGGEIGVESEKGRGSTFWFVVTLPIASEIDVVKAASAEGAATALSGRFAGRDVRLLLVEDNDINQQVAFSTLKLLGLDSDVAGDGQEALDALQRQHYDLILMDVQMPIMDGFEATRQIRDREQITKHEERSTKNKNRIPIIAMTANAMQGDREACLAAGMDDYLAKPIDSFVLAEKLQQWLPDAATEGLQLPQKSPEPSKPRVEECASNEQPVLDWEGLLDRFMGDQGVASMVLQAAVKAFPDRIQNLTNCAERGDASGVGEHAHALKGASSNVGAEQLRELAFTLELAGKKGDMDEINARITELKPAHEAFQKAACSILD